MNETVPELKLSKEDEKILNTPVALYERIRGMYGNISTEKPGDNPRIVKTIEIMLPAFQNIERHGGPTMRWSMQLENNGSGNNLYLNSKNLAFLVHWPDENTAIARIITLESVVHHYSVPANSKPFACCRYNIVGSDIFGKANLAQFSAIAEIIMKMNHFLKEY